MRKNFLCVWLLMAMCFSHASVFNQTVFAQQGEPYARKFDEFGDALPTDMAARLDNYAIQLQNEPSALAFMIGYRSHRDLPGLSSRRVHWMRNYLVSSRGLGAERVIAIDGGTASCLAHELWIVSPGATPKPREDAYARGFGDTAVSQKYDEFYYTILEDELESYSSEFENGLEGFADALRKQPRTLAYVIAYEGYRVETLEEEDARGRKRSWQRAVIDPQGTAWKELRSKKAGLAKKYGISQSRVKLVHGGYRKWREIEFWIVPRGARPPIPTPNVYPPRRKKR